MKFDKTLFAIIEDYICETALTEAVKISSKLESEYEILFVLPEFPKKAEKLVTAYKENLTNKLTDILNKNGLNARNISDKIHFVTGKPYAKNIIDFADKKNFDLIIKLPSQVYDTSVKGYQALDVTLIRRSTVPVLLINQDLHRVDTQIFVAIDPITQSKEADSLNKSLLKTADLMATAYKCTIQILSCWHFENESFMRESVFSKTSEDEIDAIINEERVNHENALKKLIQVSELQNAHDLHIHKGRADKVIPEFMNDHIDDILIMGTVGRTGLKGFLLGNTAENIFKQINCSLLTIRPE